MPTNSPITIGDTTVQPGERRSINLPLAAMYTHTDVEMTVHVINGKQPGPRLFVSAALHGDELNGVEIIRRLLKRKQINKIRGTLILIPIVNVYGFLSHSRYLPDGRDLNRSFPGSETSSLAGRVAHHFLQEIVSQCTHGIDLHTGARHRSNLPQIRADLGDQTTRTLASAFGVPVIIDSKIRDGSLREASREAGIPILLYEAGEALRFDEVCIRAGERGVLNVMRELDMMTGKSRSKLTNKKPIISHRTSWVRAPHSGVLRSLVPLGARTDVGSPLGIISDPHGNRDDAVISPCQGIVIGRTFLPLAHEGEALFHIAQYDDKTDRVFGAVEAFHEHFEPDLEEDNLLE
jgi:predicted deacylase